MARAHRCKNCEACRREVCATCENCLDSPKFGGPNTRKKPCVRRKCSNPVQNIQTENPLFIISEPFSLQQTQSGFIPENYISEDEADEKHLDDTATKIMQSIEFTELVNTTKKNMNIVSTNVVNGDEIVNVDKMFDIGDCIVEDGDLGIEEISLLETLDDNESALLQEDEECEVMELDSEVLIKNVIQHENKDNVISSFIYLFQAANLEGKISLIDKLVQPARLADQEKIFTHIFQLIQRREEKVVKEPAVKITEQENLFPAVRSECHICGSTVLTNDGLALHIKSTHGLALDIEAVSKVPDILWTKLPPDEQKVEKKITPEYERATKISKVCHICGTVIAGSGAGWRFPLFAHLARKHFSAELVRDFRTEDKNCSLCGKEEQTQCRFLVHLGAKHKLVERYLNGNAIQHYEASASNAPNLLVKASSREEREARLQHKLEARLAMKDQDEEENCPKIKPLQSNRRKAKRNQIKNQPGANIQCEFCEQKVLAPHILRSHLLSRHFKQDCVEAIKQILGQTGDICPKCPEIRFSRPFDWKVFLHFSRTHRIAENLEYSENVLNIKNVKNIVRKLRL